MRMISTNVRLAFVLLVLSVSGQSVYGQAKPDGLESELFDLGNQERQAAGLPALKWDKALANAARKHALAMAEQGSVAHRLPSEPNLPTRARQAGVRFLWLSENVVQGTSVANIHKLFMNSATHRGNLLDPEMDAAGFTVVERGGKLFAVEDFAQTK